MAAQKSVSLRNSQLDQIETTIGTSAILRIATGAQPADCATADSGTTLIAMSLPVDWLANAAAGTKSKAGTWSGTASGGAAATPGHFRFKDSGSVATHLQGSCGIGAGDISFDGTVTSGQTITIATFVITAGGA